MDCPLEHRVALLNLRHDFVEKLKEIIICVYLFFKKITALSNVYFEKIQISFRTNVFTEKAHNQIKAYFVQT